MEQAFYSLFQIQAFSGINNKRTVVESVPLLIPLGNYGTEIQPIANSSPYLLLATTQIFRARQL